MHPARIAGQGDASVLLTTRAHTRVTVSGVTMRGGSGKGDGGGIYNCTATLTLIDSAISGNEAARGHGALGYGGGAYNCPSSTMTVIDSTYGDNTAEAGGAICNGGTLTISGSTFGDNTARHKQGGAIFNYGTLTVSNSTFDGNEVLYGVGGAISNGQLFGQTGTASLNNTTLARNAAHGGPGGGIFNLHGDVIRIQNSVVSGDSPGNCSGTLTSYGYNLSSDSTCEFDGPGDLNGTDPRLGPLRDNGGPTATMALLIGSAAIDAGNPAGCTDGHGHLLKTDQRGMPRPDPGDLGGCDMGAFERQNV